MRSGISRKLIVSNIVTISCVFSIVFACVSFISYRTNKKNLEATELQIRNALLAKGQTLIVNNSLALRGMVEDNAVLDVKELVASTVKNDSDLVYGIFMQQEGKPWAVVFKENGQIAGAGYEPLGDSIAVWASTLTVPAYRFLRYKTGDIIEFAAPVTFEKSTLGVIRYGITTGSMKRMVASAQSSAQRSFLQILFLLSIIYAIAVTAAIIATRQQAVRMTNPIKSLVVSAQQFAGGDYSGEIHAETDDEIGMLSAALEQMRRTMKKYTERLQVLVDEKMQQVQDIMNNIDQGLFTINPDLSVNPEYSARANSILGFEDISAQSLDILFRLDDEGMEAMRNWVTLVKEKHGAQRWSKLARLAPVQELELPSDPEPRHVRVIFQKILAKDGSLCKIMALCQDITESRRIERKLAAERIQHENEVRTILGIVGNPPEIIADFISDTSSRLRQIYISVAHMYTHVMRQRVEYPDGRKVELSLDHLHALYRDLHTIKGNAGTYGFDLLSSHAHEAESLLENLKEPARMRRTDTLEQLKKHLTAMDRALEEIKKTVRKLSGEQDDVVLHIAQSKVKHIHALCDTAAAGKWEPEEFQKLVDACRRLNCISIAQLTKKYQNLVKRMGEKMEKNVSFECVNPSYEVAPKSFEDIDEAVVHIIRNAVDHGIEPIHERERAGKGAGTITMDFRITEKGREITIRDDGRGIDTKRLTAKALENGFVTEEAVETMTEEEKIKLVFLPGLSTAEQIGSISGRGVGMDVVGNVVTKLNGVIAVDSVPGKGTAITMTVPAPL